MTEPTGGGPQGRPLRAGDTTRQNPWPVRALSQRMAEYISKAPAAWIEGQIAQLNIRSATAFLTLRDPSVDLSVQVTCSRALLASLPVPPTEGSRVVVHGQFEFYPARGSLSFRLDQLHPVGLGELLARLERVRRLLAAEGLTAAARKKPLPFLPRTVGLITGRASAAESDVLANARARWPAVRFRVENTAVQGVGAVTGIIDALQRLDRASDVDVIVLARGGGSVEDLLPFSDETLCRAVSDCRTPVISAIGHEPDHPIVDDVADVRCSTPTDAGKRVVPDAAAESRGVEQLRARARRALTGWVDTESARLGRLTSAAVLQDPMSPLLVRADGVRRTRERARSVIAARLDGMDRDLAHRRAQLLALGPAATLARGYAVVQVGITILRSVGQAPAGTALRIRVADGALAATSAGAEQFS
ncbi:exodeoxyribonuclease VII large subunit [Nakamurella sp. UYEF19]|uniref:exodeoxyribonuclease VII large subunit n=1 Tax=Nakamurella sp. UYEF19 TaxID=1756392 RepID=UPI00339B32B0